MVMSEEDRIVWGILGRLLWGLRARGSTSSVFKVCDSCTGGTRMESSRVPSYTCSMLRLPGDAGDKKAIRSSYLVLTK